MGEKSSAKAVLNAEVGTTLARLPRDKPTALVSEPDLDDSDSSIDPEDFADEYVSLKTRMYQLRPLLFDQSPGNGSRKSKGKSTKDESDPRMRKLEMKVAKIENDILFDRDAAEMRWREKLNDLRRESAFTREKERSTVENGQVDKSQPTVTEDTGEFVMVEASDSGDDVLLGGMFTEDASDESPSIQTAASAVKVIRDFGSSVGGVSPQKLLHEVCKAR